MKIRATRYLRWHSHKTVLCFLALLVIYNEVLVYLVSYCMWPSLPTNQDSWHHVLLIADPQLVGLQNEPFSIFGSVTRWDQQRYLSSTFWMANHLLRHNPPETVVFLGDLIDEGSITLDDETYSLYAFDFHSIYGESSAIHVYLAGDNDVGGERREDPVGEEFVRRFQRFFPHEFAYDKGGPPGKLRVTALNELTHRWDKAIDADDNGPSRNAVISVAVSHLTLFAEEPPPVHFERGGGRDSKSFSRSLSSSSPDIDIAFSAHLHRTSVRVVDRTSGAIFEREDLAQTLNRGEALTIDFTHFSKMGSLFEISVPACNYRSGRRASAIGLASFHISDDGRSRLLVYSNLWLPDRIGGLYAYLAAIALTVVYFVAKRKASAK